MVTSSNTGGEGKYTALLVKTPYPPIKVEKSNLKYAQLLNISLAAASSELTSVTQYLYQKWIFKADYHETAKIIGKIAEMEMRHMQILGELIVLLGGNPMYCAVKNRKLSVWNGNMVCYATDPRQAMLENIVLEQAAINTYNEQIALIEDDCIKAVLERIILDEESHSQIFNQILCELNT